MIADIPIEGRARGWFITAEGDEYFSPCEAEALDRQRRMEAQAMGLSEPLDIPARKPGIFAITLAGQKPNPEAVAEIVDAVQRIPARLLQTWQSRGRLEVVPGVDAGRHPLYIDGGRPPLGFFSPARNIVVVAGDHRDRIRSTLHELGHALDHIIGISHRPQWAEICEADGVRQRVSKYYADSQVAGEHFAECFCNLFSGLGPIGVGASEKFCTRRAESFITSLCWE